MALVLGAAAGASVARSISLGFYAVGCFLAIAGFFAGNRGPVRAREGESTGGTFVVPFSTRRVRWATAEERDEAISMGTVFVALGFTLIFAGAAIDPRVSLV